MAAVRSLPKTPVQVLEISARGLRDRLASRYWVVLVAGQTLPWVIVSGSWFPLIAPYFGESGALVLEVSCGSVLFTSVAGIYAAARARPAFRVVVTWCRTERPNAEQTLEAWRVSTMSAYQQYRRDAVHVNVIAVAPSFALAITAWHVSATGAASLAVASLLPAALATVLGYGVLEILLRPIVAEVAAELPVDFDFARMGLPLRQRLRGTVLVFTSSASMAGLSLASTGGGPERLLYQATVSLGVGLFVSAWLDAILAHGITEPVDALRAGIERVRQDDLATNLRVTASDELGELTVAFNQMAVGLREQERLREMFATYMDKEVARIVMADEIPESGFEIDVSIVFCDIRGFTEFADRAPPTAVISSLNGVFSLIVPIVEQYGGHVEKFIGDGMLAIFGAPEEYPDHADRALAAAREMVARVRSSTTGMSVVAGVNSGQVVAGTIGGAGRLNFSVIGDAVNVAARVECLTRETGDDILLTSATRAALTRSAEMTPRGFFDLKGKPHPIELFAAQRMDEPADPGNRGHAPLTVPPSEKLSARRDILAVSRSDDR